MTARQSLFVQLFRHRSDSRVLPLYKPRLQPRTKLMENTEPIFYGWILIDLHRARVRIPWTIKLIAPNWRACTAIQFDGL